MHPGGGLHPAHWPPRQVRPVTDRLIIDRDRRCVRCGVADGLHVHHRVLQSSGRNENASNKITLCARCHQWVHDHPRLARIQGWIVSRYADPAAQPVKHIGQGGIFVLLNDTYGFTPWPPPEENQQ
jgi:hypothetical protein